MQSNISLPMIIPAPRYKVLFLLITRWTESFKSCKLKLVLDAACPLLPLRDYRNHVSRVRLCTDKVNEALARNRSINIAVVLAP
eukprot:1840815-Amphidinium_carterae.2